MKIVYLSPSAQLGGAERLLLDLLASLRQAEPGWSLHLIVSSEGPLVDQARELNIQTTVLPFPPGLMVLGDAGASGPAGDQRGRLALMRRLIRASPAVASYLRRLRQIISTLKPDVIHTNGFKMHVMGIWASPRGVPVIWHIHDYVSTRPVMAHLLRLSARRCAVAVANSESVAQDTRMACRNRLRVLTVYNGIDLENFSPTGPTLDLDKLSGMPPAPLRTIKVGMLATLARWKGHATFLQALAMLPADSNVRGYIVGDALYQTSGSQYTLEDLKRLIDSLRLSHRVGLIGFASDPASVMRSLDIIAHASTQPEPFGLVIAEGMACGRAVIVSQAGGAAELIETEINALGHPPGDAVRLAERITLLAADSRLRARLGAAGRTTAEKRFNRARMATALIPIYHSVAPSA